jgi:hypothetical protein
VNVINPNALRVFVISPHPEMEAITNRMNDPKITDAARNATMPSNRYPDGLANGDPEFSADRFSAPLRTRSVPCGS